MRFLKSWDSLVITDFLSKSLYRMEKELPIASAKSQARSLLDLTERLNLNQMVKDGTRMDNILDLVLTNSWR